LRVRVLTPALDRCVMRRVWMAATAAAAMEAKTCKKGRVRGSYLRLLR